VLFCISTAKIHVYCWKVKKCTKDIFSCLKNQSKAFENWLFHELSVHAKYSELFYDLSYWRLSSGIEVDFILGLGTVAIEAKGKSKITSGDIRGLVNFKKDFPEVKWLIIVCLEKRIRKTDEGIYVVPYQEFTKLLWDGKWIKSSVAALSD